ncbi:heterokaryon incompatibility protein-domain-containing protein, partial [Phlebopus sp. FC_14]
MHLLNVHTLALETFSSDIPPYVALSHRWGNREDEVFYQDIMQLSVRRDIVKKPGFAKILGCCNEAAKNRLSYVWVDTCCINQMNSVEVQEAINSMWQWYLECNRCFVYLSDVRSDQVLDANDSDFARSQWFKRGWTLQELLAPAKVIFFAADWKKIGRKGHPRVTNRISLVTGIPEQVLLDGDISSLSVARRLFWASKRETTRREDRAYSLMGLFDITMPIIYGGLDNTFVRFQKEIMKTSVDHSIFAWTVDSASPDITTGLLAPSPAYFMNVDEISYDDFILNFSTRIEAGRALKADYTSTNNGIAISLPMRQVADSVYLAMLRCTLLPESARPLCIYLQKLAGQRNQWVRIRIGE